MKTLKDYFKQQLDEMGDIDPTALSPEEMSSLIDYMHELLTTREVGDPIEAAYLALEDIAGFEVDPGATKRTASQLANMYVEKYRE